MAVPSSIIHGILEGNPPVYRETRYLCTEARVTVMLRSTRYYMGRHLYWIEVRPLPTAFSEEEPTHAAAGTELELRGDLQDPRCQKADRKLYLYRSLVLHGRRSITTRTKLLELSVSSGYCPGPKGKIPGYARNARTEGILLLSGTSSEVSMPLNSQEDINKVRHCGRMHEKPLALQGLLSTALANSRMLESKKRCART
ncbi:hypothetical protein PENSPDRAFT_662452 [Peniophora sp. CONT]|nr:hypothetical protein PENSPDRAFT_662452 [Peniophora sp. CONT]